MDQRDDSKHAERTGHPYRLAALLVACCLSALAVVAHISLAQDLPAAAVTGVEESERAASGSQASTGADGIGPIAGDDPSPSPTAGTCEGQWLPVAAEPLGGQITLGVDSQTACGGEAEWTQFGPIGFDQYGPGEFAGPARLPVMSEYRLRIDDTVLFVFRLTRERTTKVYRLNVGDKLLVDSVNNKDINREVQIQPDGSVVLFLLGTVPAAGRSVDEFRAEIQKLYAEYYRDDIISVTPKQIDTRLQDLLAAVDNRQGNQGGQSLNGRVTPAGTLQLPGVGSVLAQGLTLDELATEINLRYGQITPGLEVTPILTARATPLAYVLGEVRQPSQISLQRPTTVMQAIALAGGWGIGGNLREIVVFRRADDWRLIATRIDLRGALLGKRPCPADEIWLRDSDVVLVPKTPLKRTTDLVESVFADGVNHLILFGAAAGVLELSTVQ